MTPWIDTHCHLDGFEFAPDRDAEAERTLWMKEYIARVLRIVQQETEALEGGAMDVPMEEVMDELRDQ